MLKDASGIDDLGQRFGADLTAAEVRYLIGHEWAQTADDVLWRRSKLGLRFSAAQRAQLEGFMGTVNSAEWEVLEQKFLLLTVAGNSTIRSNFSDQLHDNFMR